jgi:hypothetical protein
MDFINNQTSEWNPFNSKYSIKFANRIGQPKLQTPYKKILKEIAWRSASPGTWLRKPSKWAIIKYGN